MKQADIFMKLGRYFLHEGSYDLVINVLSKAIELDPDDALAYDLRGIAHGRQYEYEEAIADCGMALQIDNTFAGAYCNRGLSFYKKIIIKRSS